jgi:hypothetical protein
MKASADATRLADELATMAGSEVWSTKLGIGSHLTVDLGAEVERRLVYGGKEHTYVVGEWHLWIQLAAWRLEDAARVLLGSEDPRPVIAERIAVLQGRRITAVEVKAPGLETVFDFDGVRLLTFSVHSGLASASEVSGRTQWSLWRPQGDIVSVSQASWVAINSNSST